MDTKSFGTIPEPRKLPTTPELDAMLEAWAVAERANIKRERRREVLGLVFVFVAVLLALGLAGGSDMGLF